MKLYNLISKVIAIGLIFIAPMVVVIQRYTQETTTQVVTTSSSIGLLPSIFILGILGVALWFVSNQFKEILAQSKFGWLAIVFFGLILGLILFGSWFIINSVVIAAQTDINSFVDTMAYHRQTLFYMLYPIGGGIALGVLSKIMNIDLVKTWLGNLV